MGGGLKMRNFNFKNTYFFDSAHLDMKGKIGVVSHICIYKINNGVAARLSGGNLCCNMYINAPVVCRGENPPVVLFQPREKYMCLDSGDPETHFTQFSTVWRIKS